MATLPDASCSASNKLVMRYPDNVKNTDTPRYPAGSHDTPA